MSETINFDELYDKGFQTVHAGLIAQLKTVSEGKIPDGLSLMSSNGLRFGRLLDGSVLIVVGKDGEDLQLFTQADNLWASVICHVSAGGEDYARWFDAMNWHNQETSVVLHICEGKIVSS